VRLAATPVLALVACHAARPPAPPLPVTATPALAFAPALGAFTPIVEQGDAVYVLDGRVATVLRGGAIAARSEASRAWTSAASIAAPDGDGRWVVATDEDGALWRLMTSGEREQVGERFGLGGAKVRQVGGAGTTTAFDLGDAIAFSVDGTHLVRVPADPGYRFAVARGVIARSVQGRAGVHPHLEIWNLAHATRVTYSLAADELAFLDADADHPRLVATEGRRVWIDDGGELRATAAPDIVHGVAAQRDRLWLAAGGRLFTLVDGHVVPTAFADRAMLHLLAAAQTGDAWLATTRGLVRASLSAARDDDRWQAQVAPVFQRVCAHCHLPGGEAGLDLSTSAAWATERAEIARRVLITHTMPPAGTDLTDADRDALAIWLQRK
jgi:mono/diheme cytochrome c family protein